MKKRFLSLLCVLALCLGLLPVTALAAAPNGQALYVGGVQISSTGYWTTDSDGNVTSAGTTQPGDNYIHYNANDNILTLHNATIQKELNDSNLFISGSAIGVINQNGNAELTIQLEGSNTIEETNQGLSMGIYVYSSKGGAALNIKGNGTLVLNSNYQTIQVISSNGNAALSIENAKVTATSSYGFGVTVRSGSSETSSASLTVDGGSLTATAQSSGVSGIRLWFGTGGTSDGTPTVTVSNNTIVRANGSAGGITSNSSTGIQYETGGKETGGIIWNGTEGTVYGNVTLQEDLEIGEGESLTLDDGANLSAGDHNVIVDGGTLDESLANSLGDRVKYAPAITNHPKNVEVKEDETATFTVEATGSDLSYQWQQSTDKGSSWTNIASATSDTYTTGKTTMDMSGTQYRCVVENIVNKVTSDAATLTVQKATTPIDPKYVRYIVEHYKQNADGSYTLADTEQPIDEIGKTVTATPKTYEGYTYNPNAAGTVVSGTLKEISSPDDIVTLKLYYDITLYTVTVNGSYAQTTGAGSYAKDTTVTIDAGTRSGYTFNGWTSTDGVTFANAGSAQTTFTMPDKAVTVTANWTANSSGGSSDPTYSVSLPSQVTGGSVTATKRYAEKGETFRFTVTPDEGYELDTLTVTDSKGKEIDLTHKGGNEYTFKMPAGRVEIEVSFREIAVELPFMDVAENAWYEDAAAYVYEHSLMAGTSTTTFAPDATTSRSMIATILWRMAGSPVVNYAMDYTDVAQGQWYSEAIRWATSEGVVTGYGNGLFGTNDPITREQFAAMLYRFAQTKGYDVSIGENTNILSYTDVADLSEYAIPAMQWAVGAGIINGTGDGSTLTPQGQATRAQAAVMLMRFCEEYVTW